MRVSLTEAAQLLGLSPRQVRYRIQKGEIKAHKSGGRWVIEDTELPVSEARRQALTRGGHAFHDRAKTEHYRDARLHASDAVGWLLMDGMDAAQALVDRVEAEVLPALAGLLRRHERRARQ